MHKKKWKSRSTAGTTNTYGIAKVGFAPFEDNNNNLCVGLADGENTNLPFADEIKACEQIDFVPKLMLRK